MRGLKPARTRFGQAPLTQLRMRTCQRWGITPGAFDALPEDERIEMMAFVRYQDKRANTFRDLLIDRNALESAAATLLTVRTL